MCTLWEERKQIGGGKTKTKIKTKKRVKGNYDGVEKNEHKK